MFSNSENFIQLQNTYRRPAADLFGLFLGAGINKPVKGIKSKYKTYDWEELVSELYHRNAGKYDESFDILYKKYSNNWPRLFSILAAPLDLSEFIEEIDRIIHNDIPRGDPRGRLSKRFLQQAPSLQASICFSAKISKKTPTASTFVRNPKIGTIITLNYDFFFGAGWTRYQSFRQHWKVETPFGQAQVKPNQRPINYIHGYIPYRFGKKKEIVLTEESYKTAYSPDGFARRTLETALAKYHFVFIGTSFIDSDLCEILHRLRKLNTPQHFAIVKSNLADKVNSLGIRGIFVDDYALIPQVLEKIYCSALRTLDLKNYGFLSEQEYWQQLQKGPRT
jgi:hypothetical protein